MNACPHALLNHPDLGVRPPGVPLPTALAQDGGLLAAVFKRWLRQRDDEAHAGEKAVLIKVMRALPDDEVRHEARRQAFLAAPRDAGVGLDWGADVGLRRLHGLDSHGKDPTHWDHWLWAVPAATIAALLGLRMDTMDRQRWLVHALRIIAAALATDATPTAVQAANVSTHALLMALREAEATAPDAPLQSAWLHHTRRASGSDALTGEAQRLALLWQSHEAGTALLSHGLRHLVDTGQAPGRETLRRIAQEGGAVRLTRRFAQKAISSEGLALEMGAPVTVHLVGQDLAFGAGAHACPGQSASLACIESALQWAAEQSMCPLPRHCLPLSLPNMDILLTAAAVPTTEVLP